MVWSLLSETTGSRRSASKKCCINTLVVVFMVSPFSLTTGSQHSASKKMLYKLLASIFRATSCSNCYVSELVADDASMVPEAIQVC